MVQIPKLHANFLKILTCLRNIADVRNMERKQLQTAAFLQSFSNTITPAITLLASISTFLAYRYYFKCSKLSLIFL